MSNLRSAPTGGYDNDAKHGYRKLVWGIAAKLPDAKARRVFVLPAAEAREVKFLLSNGYRQDRIVICDRNPATIATIRRSKDKHGLGYGLTIPCACDVADAGRRLRQRGLSVSVAHLDLTGNMSAKLIDTVVRFVATCPWDAPVNLVMVNSMRGRERRPVYDALQDIASKLPEDAELYGTRNAILIRKIAAAAWHQRMACLPINDGHGVYVSGAVPMNFVCCALYRWDEVGRQGLSDPSWAASASWAARLAEAEYNGMRDEGFNWEAL